MTAQVVPLGRVGYSEVFDAMKAYNARATAEHLPDQFWQVEHPPVFTLGLAGKRDHLLHDIGVPVVESDRGGQITYHGPGQVVIYTLLDLKRAGLGVRELVNRIEQAVIDLLAGHGVEARRRAGAPGVYVGPAGDDAKIAALGLRVKHGHTYHGVSLNVDMDLSPFAAINPCGYSGLRVTQTRELGIDLPPEAICRQLTDALQRALYG
ncbi:lipoyl(octanoyl) transferase LipB [Methyloversatilis sp.]|uniref:lipoyl(octanoyl) transferase LipB n=1 Tax=Methyloversatilis sp. TaxID=2569862 RepID=UPI002733D1DD|nr:lipoyl(octanoyl) transferase LipB [Methyloversatilis sp.]MDP2869584.1 lipoyl(octanoyl) transferase LipB [Methyloversatilis sp.]MDP3289191.1 lipoyl(octanoyl) transferase LipB [Methyloversatilis sp.]MDP3456145.1 lipoyl(octanoyl) transferase LipB [Methyloversatilis sp.]MDP3577398.1 lipoyl(octanoyl) transferase LipB [Methyloversatilis sp.]